MGIDEESVLGIQRESIWIMCGDHNLLRGQLFLGHDGLPELEVQYETPIDRYVTTRYRPATFPAAWTLRAMAGDSGPLLFAWERIALIQTELAEHEREARQCISRNRVEELLKAGRR